MALKRTFVRIMAWVYAAGFAFVVFVSHVPIFNDAQGRLFGLFQIDLRDDVVHLLSAIAGAIVSSLGRWIIPYFWAVGLLYGADAAIGMVVQRGLLDLTIFTQALGSPDFGLRNFEINLPHIVIAGLALALAVRFSSAPSVPPRSGPHAAA